MIENQTTHWNSESLRILRLRMGWCKSDLARRLQVSAEEIELWEEGVRGIDASLIGHLELLLRQAEACCDEVKHMPAAENQCESKALEQIDFSRVKEDLE